jgi:hypothetical protein
MLGDIEEARAMRVARIGTVVLFMALSACASPSEPGFNGQRTVFSNP